MEGDPHLPARSLSSASEPSGIEGNGSPPPKPNGRRWTVAPLVTGLLALAAVVMIVLHFSDVGAFAALVRTARPEWLLAATVLQLLTYFCATGVWRLSIDRAGFPLPFREIFPLGVGKLFVDQVVPAGVGGAALVVRALVRRGVPAYAVVTALLVSLASYYAAYFVFVIGAVATMWVRGDLHPAALAAVSVFSAFVIGSPTLILFLADRGRGTLPTWAQRLPGAKDMAEAVAGAHLHFLKSPRLILQAITLQLTIFFLDALTLWVVFQALASPVSLATSYQAFAMGAVAGLIGLVPMGLGTFEAASIGTLRLDGVPLETALAATLLLRGFTMWLPMLPGLWVARQEIEG